MIDAHMQQLEVVQDVLIPELDAEALQMAGGLVGAMIAETQVEMGVHDGELIRHMRLLDRARLGIAQGLTVSDLRQRLDHTIERPPASFTQTVSVPAGVHEATLRRTWQRTVPHHAEGISVQRDLNTEADQQSATAYALRLTLGGHDDEITAATEKIALVKATARSQGVLRNRRIAAGV